MNLLRRRNKVKRFRRLWKLLFAKHYIFFSFVYIFINFFFNRYTAIGFYLLYLLYIFFKDNPRVKQYLANKEQNDANLMYNYRTNFYLNLIYLFTRYVYIFSFINFLIQGNVSFLRNNSVYIFGLVVFALLIDFLACCYIIRYKNVGSEIRYLLETYGPKVIIVLIPSYSTYAVTNPTHEFSHLYHRYGPRIFGAMKCVVYSDLQLNYYNHIRTVHPTGDISFYLSSNGVPDLSVIKYRIHTDPVLYYKWRNEIPENLWNIYGLDKRYGEGLNKEILDNLKYKGVVGKAQVLEQIRNRNNP